jgi:Rrf2 family protein
MFSRFTGYALKAMAYLACQAPGRLTGAREIAAATEIPIPFLWKVLRHLNTSGFVNSAKGVRGGYELAHPAKRITLMSVVKATQREDPGEGCAMGLTDCDDTNACPLHKPWKRIRDNIHTMLLETTVADLAGHDSAFFAPARSDLMPRRRPKRSRKRS